MSALSRLGKSEHTIQSDEQGAEYRLESNQIWNVNLHNVITPVVSESSTLDTTYRAYIVALQSYGETWLSELSLPRCITKEADFKWRRVFSQNRQMDIQAFLADMLLHTV